MKDIVLLDLIWILKESQFFDLFIYGIPNHGRLKSYTKFAIVSSYFRKVIRMFYEFFKNFFLREISFVVYVHALICAR